MKIFEHKDDLKKEKRRKTKIYQAEKKPLKAAREKELGSMALLSILFFTKASCSLSFASMVKRLKEVMAMVELNSNPSCFPPFSNFFILLSKSSATKEAISAITCVCDSKITEKPKGPYIAEVLR